MGTVEHFEFSTQIMFCLVYVIVDFCRGWTQLFGWKPDILSSSSRIRGQNHHIRPIKHGTNFLHLLHEGENHHIKLMGHSSSQWKYEELKEIILVIRRYNHVI